MAAQDTSTQTQQSAQQPAPPQPAPRGPGLMERFFSRRQAKQAKGERMKKIDEQHKLEEARRIYEEGVSSIKDLIAPAAMEITFNYLRLEDYFVRTLFVFTYPRYINTNWLSPVINYDVTMDISMFIYPVETKEVMQNLRKKVGQMESAWQINREKGKVRDPELETALGDAEDLRDRLQRGEEKLFQCALYFTLYAKSKEELDTLTKQLESTLGGKLVFTKYANLQMEAGFNSSLPTGTDELRVTRNMDTESLSTTFPFTSSELTQSDGILYGINRHNNGLILFDRFTLENANMVLFAKSGSGKSYAVKLELLRSLMFGTEAIIIDPENEYKPLTAAVGGKYIEVNLNSEHNINPFDLPPAIDDDEDGESILRSAVVNLHGLISLMVGDVTPEEDALIDRALLETYALRDITAELESQKNPAPTLTDFHEVLMNMQGAENVAAKLSKYVDGSFSGLLNKPSNVSLDSHFLTFSIRDLEDSLRPIAMYMILNHIWNLIRTDRKKRMMVIDEAWLMMGHEDSAKFLYSLAKRARKYYLGLTTVTQDVEDFLGSKYGKAIVTNSSIQMLLRQSPASIDLIAQTFNLTEGEKMLLLESEVGEGLFFAGLNHVAIKVLASYAEDQIITTNPQQLEQLEDAGLLPGG
jgi:conjugal transfer ATP-binding protein TraC